jgi:Smg protein
MFDVLVYLYETGGPFAHALADHAVLSRKLAAVGFSDDEIGAALTWLHALSQAQPAPRLGTHAHAFRVYADFERHRLGAEGIALLLYLESAGQLSSDERELVLERALAVDTALVSLAQLKVIVLMVLWSRRADIDALLIEELLVDEDTEEEGAEDDGRPVARGPRH